MNGLVKEGSGEEPGADGETDFYSTGGGLILAAGRARITCNP